MAGKKKSYPDLKFLFIRGLISYERFQRSKHYLKSAADCTSKAIVSLELADTQIKSVKQAEQLEGIGSALCKKLKEFQGDHRFSSGRPFPGTYASSAGAILVAMLDIIDDILATQDSPDSCVLVPEERIMKRASEMSEEMFQNNSEGFCQAWWRMTPLCSRGFIKERSLKKKTVYELLPLGQEVAHRLRGTNPEAVITPTKAKKYKVSPQKVAPQAKGDALYTNDGGQDGIIMLVDTKEMGGDRNKLCQFTRMLERAKVCYRTKSLHCGDYAWLWRCAGVERQLPILVERKRADDLAHSLVDGRYSNQKKKMIEWKRQQSMDAHLKYLIESDPHQYVVRCADGCGGVGKCGNPSAVQLENLIKDLDKDENFDLIRTDNVEGTVDILTLITKELKQRLEQGDFDGLLSLDNRDTNTCKGASRSHQDAANMVLTDSQNIRRPLPKYNPSQKSEPKTSNADHISDTREVNTGWTNQRFGFDSKQDKQKMDEDCDGLLSSPLVQYHCAVRKTPAKPGTPGRETKFSSATCASVGRDCRTLLGMETKTSSATVTSAGRGYESVLSKEAKSSSATVTSVDRHCGNSGKEAKPRSTTVTPSDIKCGVGHRASQVKGHEIDCNDNFNQGVMEMDESLLRPLTSLTGSAASCKKKISPPTSASKPNIGELKTRTPSSLTMSISNPDNAKRKRKVRRMQLPSFDDEVENDDTSGFQGNENVETLLKVEPSLNDCMKTSSDRFHFQTTSPRITNQISCKQSGVVYRRMVPKRELCDLASDSEDIIPRKLGKYVLDSETTSSDHDDLQLSSDTDKGYYSLEMRSDKTNTAKKFDLRCVPTAGSSKDKIEVEDFDICNTDHDEGDSKINELAVIPNSIRKVEASKTLETYRKGTHGNLKKNSKVSDDLWLSSDSLPDINEETDHVGLDIDDINCDSDNSVASLPPAHTAWMTLDDDTGTNITDDYNDGNTSKTSLNISATSQDSPDSVVFGSAQESHLNVQTNKDISSQNSRSKRDAVGRTLYDESSTGDDSVNNHSVLNIQNEASLYSKQVETVVGILPSAKQHVVLRLLETYEGNVEMVVSSLLDSAPSSIDEEVVDLTDSQ